MAVQSLDEMLRDKIALDGGWTGSSRPRWMALDALPCRFTLDWMIRGGRVAQPSLSGLYLDSLGPAIGFRRTIRSYR